MKKHLLLLFLFLVSVMTSETITSIPLTAGQYGPYLGHTSSNNPPGFEFYPEDGVEIYSSGQYNIAFLVHAGGDSNWLTLPYGGITSISYKASWEDKPIQIWEWSINDPANLSDDDPNGTFSFFYAIDASNLPKGSHHIQIFVEGIGYGWMGGYSTFSMNGSTVFRFSVIDPSSDPDSQNTGNSSLVWNPQTIDNMGAGAYVFNSPLVVLDSNDVPHIAYSQMINFPQSRQRFVVYSSWNGFAWTTQSLCTGTPYSLALDNNDSPHLVHGFFGDIAYTTFNGTNWVTQTIDSIGSGIGNVFGEIALDSSTKPHVVYCFGNTIKYATLEGTKWRIKTIEEIESEHNDLIHLSFRLDKNDTPYVLYGSLFSYDDKITNETIPALIVKLAVYENSNWSIQTIPLPQPITGYGNLVFDSMDNPYFIYSQFQLDSTNQSLSKILTANWDGNTWNTQDVVSNVTLGGTYSGRSNWVDIGYLALDSNDYPKMCYIDNGTLTYASWRGKSWKITSIDTNPQEGEAGFLTLDSKDKPHITYIGPRAHTNWISYSYADVRYATSTDANGEVEQEEIPNPDYSIPIATAIGTAILATGLVIYFKIQKRKQPV